MLKESIICSSLNFWSIIVYVYTCCNHILVYQCQSVSFILIIYIYIYICCTHFHLCTLFIICCQTTSEFWVRWPAEVTTLPSKPSLLTDIRSLASVICLLSLHWAFRWFDCPSPGLLLQMHWHLWIRTSMVRTIPSMKRWLCLFCTWPILYTYLL